MATAVLQSKASSVAKKQHKSITDEPIKWSAQMLESFEQAKRGEWKILDLNNFWDV